MTPTPADGKNPVTGRLAIVAGGGILPVIVAHAARKAGHEPFIVTIAGEAGQDWTGFDHASIAIADFAGFSRLVRDQSIGTVVLSGWIRRRPDWNEMRPTWNTLSAAPAMIRRLVSGGDDAVLRSVIALMEAEGVQVIGAHDVAPSLLAEAGPLGRHTPDKAALIDIRKAAEAARLIGALDFGQGAVAVGSRIVALEGPEGTDQMLMRVRQMRDEGRISRKRPGVLVKLCKPGQDERADLPAIGAGTVENAAAAGLSGIAVEAGRTLTLDRDAIRTAADKAGLFVFGIDPDLLSRDGDGA